MKEGREGIQTEGSRTQTAMAGSKLTESLRISSESDSPTLSSSADAVKVVKPARGEGTAGPEVEGVVADAEDEAMIDGKLVMSKSPRSLGKS